MSSSADERRHFSRIAFDSNVTLSQANNKWVATLIDLSLKGLLIEEPQSWQLDRSQTLDVAIVLNEDVTITMTVLWRHSENGQAGFECDHLDLDLSLIHI